MDSSNHVLARPTLSGFCKCIGLILVGWSLNSWFGESEWLKGSWEVSVDDDLLHEGAVLRPNKFVWTAGEERGESGNSTDGQEVVLPGPTFWNEKKTGEKRIVYLMDMVLVPRFGHILVSSITPRVFANTREYEVFWTHPKYKYTQLAAHHCDYFDRIVIEVDGRRFKSAKCTKLRFLGGNIINKGVHSLFRFPKGELRALHNYKQDSIRVFIDDSRFVTIPLRSRTAGLLKDTTRASMNYNDYTEFYNPFGNNAKSQISACLKLINNANPYLEQVIQYYRSSLGFSHVYLGFFGPDEEYTKVVTRLRWYIKEGFLSLVRMNKAHEYMTLQRAKPLFLNACLHHAKQFDTYVGVFDFDELPLVTDPRVANQSKIDFGKYLTTNQVDPTVAVVSETRSVDKVRDGINKAKVSTPEELEIQLLSENDVAETSRPKEPSYYAEWILHTVSVVEKKVPIVDRTGHLEEDFSVVLGLPGSWGNHKEYMKTIATAPTVNLVEIHKHTNMQVTDSTGLRFQSQAIQQKIPYNRRILANPYRVVLAHFPNLYISRQPGCVPANKPGKCVNFQDWAKRFHAFTNDMSTSIEAP